MDCLDCLRDHQEISLHSSSVVKSLPLTRQHNKQRIDLRVSLRRRPHAHNLKGDQWLRDSLPATLSPQHKQSPFLRKSVSHTSFPILSQMERSQEKSIAVGRQARQLRRQGGDEQNLYYLGPIKRTSPCLIKFNIVGSTAQHSKQSINLQSSVPHIKVLKPSQEPIRIELSESQKPSLPRPKPKYNFQEELEKGIRESEKKYASANYIHMKKSDDKIYLSPRMDMEREEKVLSRSLIIIKRLDEIECTQSIPGDSSAKDSSQFSEVVEKSGKAVMREKWQSREESMMGGVFSEQEVQGRMKRRNTKSQLLMP